MVLVKAPSEGPAQYHGDLWRPVCSGDVQTTSRVEILPRNTVHPELIHVLIPLQDRISPHAARRVHVAHVMRDGLAAH